MFHVITQPNCVWCVKVKELLAEKSQQFTSWEPNKSDLRFVAGILGFRTVPQVFDDTTLIGGYEDTKHYLEDNDQS